MANELTLSAHVLAWELWMLGDIVIPDAEYCDECGVEEVECEFDICDECAAGGH